MIPFDSIVDFDSAEPNLKPGEADRSKSKKQIQKTMQKIYIHTEKIKNITVRKHTEYCVYRYSVKDSANCSI